MIIKHKVTVSVNGVIITPTSFDIVMGVGKGYNSCSLVGVDIVCDVGDYVSITIDSIRNNFIIVTKEYSQLGSIDLKCYGVTYELENEYDSIPTADFTNSDELINGCKGSIEVSNNLPLIDFKGKTYTKSGTNLSKIKDMVDVINGDIYEANNKLYLEEFKIIPENCTPDFRIDDAFSYSYSDKLDYTRKTKRVLINPINHNIESKPSLNFDTNGGIGEILFNPSLSVGFSYVSNGLKVRQPQYTTQEETFNITNTSYIETLAGIDSIEYVLYNAEKYYDYDFVAGYNILTFDKYLTGVIEVKYITRNVLVDISSTSKFNITYQCLEIDDVVQYDGKYSCSGVVGEKGITLLDGGNVYISGQNDITLLFTEGKGIGTQTQLDNILQIEDTGYSVTIKHSYSDKEWNVRQFLKDIIVEKAPYYETFKSTITYDTILDKYIITTPVGTTDVNGVLFGSTKLEFTYEYPYIYFNSDDSGKQVDVSIQKEYYKIQIPPIGVTSEAKLLDVIGCNSVTTTPILFGESDLCALPSTFQIDVASYLGVELAECVGKTVTGDLGTHVIDEFGLIVVTVTDRKKYVIDCRGIYKSSTDRQATIIVDSTSVERY